jgi:hypothetical protein
LNCPETANPSRGKNMLHCGLNLLAIPDEVRKITKVRIAEMLLCFPFDHIISKNVVTTKTEILKTPATGKTERYTQPDSCIELVPFL